MLVDSLTGPLDIPSDSPLPQIERQRIAYCGVALEWARTVGANEGVAPMAVMQKFEQLIADKEWPEWHCDATTAAALRRYMDAGIPPARCALANVQIFLSHADANKTSDADEDSDLSSELQKAGGNEASTGAGEKTDGAHADDEYDQVFDFENGFDDFVDGGDAASAAADAAAANPAAARAAVERHIEYWKRHLEAAVDEGDSTAPLDMVKLLYLKEYDGSSLAGRSGSPPARLSARDVADIVHYYELGVERELVGMCAGLGAIYESGHDGVLEPNAQKAEYYYRLGTSRGCEEAPFRLAELLENGAPGVEQNLEEALAQYYVAHRRKHPSAGSRIAALVLHDEELEMMYESQEHHHTQIRRRRLSQLQQTHDDDSDNISDNAGALAPPLPGLPTADDVRRAREALEESVELGSIDAMHDLARLLENGAPGLPVSAQTRLRARKLYLTSILLQRRKTPALRAHHEDPNGVCCDHGCVGRRRIESANRRAGYIASVPVASPSDAPCLCATALCNLGWMDFEDMRYARAAELWWLAKKRGCISATENVASWYVYERCSLFLPLSFSPSHYAPNIRFGCYLGAWQCARWLTWQCAC